MIGVLVITHGDVGGELLKAAETIVGKQDNVLALGLTIVEGVESFQKKIAVAMTELSGKEGVLVLVDMMGGTPANAALRQLHNPALVFDLVTGINLPMMVSAFTNRKEMTLDQLAQKLSEVGPRSVMRPVKKVRESMS